MVGRVGAMVSFVEGSTVMQELAAVPVDPKQVERTAEALGREIAADERRLVEPEPPAAPTMYLGMDGTGVPMRASELAGPAGKPRDAPGRRRAGPRPGALGVCPARGPRSAPPRLRPGRAARGPGRRRSVDLEPGRRAVPWRHPDRRPLPRQAAPLRRGP